MLSFCLNFYQFQPGVAYKSVAYKKVCIWMTKSGGTQHHTHKNCTWLLTSSCNSAIDILHWKWFLNYFWLQEKNFFNPANSPWFSQQSLHLKNPFRKNVMRLLVWGPFSPASICKYWTSMMMMTQACSQHSQISTMDYFAIMING